MVTANKEVMAKHGPELVDLAQKRRVSLLFEASVGGGIPIIGPLMKDLLANEVKSIHAIINGTTNYILTRMSTQGLDFQEALREAQRLGWLVRARWGIENHDFLVRDVTFGEDRCLVRGLAALGLAHLRGFAINCLRVWGLSNLTAALERFAARPFELLARLGGA